MHTVTFSHRVLLFGSKLEFPWDCGTIQNHAKTLPCARSLWISKVKPNYTIRNSLPGSICDINLSQITLFTATMLMNNCRVFKILQNCTFLLFSHQIFLYKFVSRLCGNLTSGPRKQISCKFHFWSPEVKFACIIKLRIHGQYFSRDDNAIFVKSLHCRRKKWLHGQLSVQRYHITLNFIGW